ASSLGPLPTDHGYRVPWLKYEDCWPSPGYSQGGISFSSSWRGSSRPSTSLANKAKEDVDARHKAWHDDERSRWRSRKQRFPRLPLQKPPRGDPRQMRDRPVVEVGPGLAHRAIV